VQVDARRVRVERCRDFGGPWLALKLAQRLRLERFLEETVPSGRQDIPWAQMALVLVVARLCNPSSELHIAEHFYRDSGLADLLGVPPNKVNEDRLYRSLDALLPHKQELEGFLKERLGTLFGIDYDLVLYDITSTYFEGEAKGNALAQYGYSRDRRSDCKQVCIGLVVSREGMPFGYEVFPGNCGDAATVEGIVQRMERRYGEANRIWVLDRGMISEQKVRFFKEGGRRYIVGTPRSMLRAFERELLRDDWQSVQQGLEAKVCRSPDGEETFVLCRSRARRDKERAMHERFERRIEEGLRKIEASCLKHNYKPVTIAKRVGRLLERNSRAAGLFQTDVRPAADGGTRLVWKKVQERRDWSALSEGCYLLRSNITDWSAEDLWRAYIQLTEAEAAFRIQKSDLRIRPIWHQRQDRVRAHILVCFLAYVLWKTLAQMCQQAGLGQEPRRVFEELSKVKVVDVILPTRSGIEIRKRCVTQPTDHQAILLQRLGLQLPQSMEIAEV
jgi:transposase